MTVIGALLSPAAGTHLVMEGQWETHARFGRQFRVSRFRAHAPSTPSGIRKYLGSGMIKGLGPAMAERIVRQFGSETLTVIETTPHRLAEVEGIGKKRIAMIETACNDRKAVRDVMIFLQSHGVGTGFAAKIFRHYGADSIRVVQNNPYVLATEVRGIGFKTADAVAAGLGFPPDSPFRVRAGVLFVLESQSEEGHVCLPYPNLIALCADLLTVDPPLVDQALRELIRDRKVIADDRFADAGKGPSLYPAPLFFCEQGVARRLIDLTAASVDKTPSEAEADLAWVESRLAISLAPLQKQAVQTALTSKVMVVTGGPGTGKTTLINALLKIFTRREKRIMLGAPTGRAAKRMGETTGRNARTIHRMLEFSFKEGGFQRNENRPLSCDVLVIDEASMIDIVLMYQLLKAVPPQAVLILVGDVNQLPSVGPGHVLAHIIASGLCPVVTLSEIFRQAGRSRIIVNAHRINQGQMPLTGRAEAGDDYYFIETDDPDKALDLIVELVTRRIPRRFNHDPLADIQVLTPMHKGTLGSENLNTRLQAALNPEGPELARGNRIFRVNDKVMQMRNNYDKDVFNGDIGRIRAVDPDNQTVRVAFDDHDVVYESPELDEIQPAYAISVHKSQGSEYPAVVMPVTTQHYILLQRNLLYTGVTRGRDLVVLVGSKKALAMAVGNTTTRERHSHLVRRLQP
ncbi:ATP-dependent RecD-like DNA helicase [Desulfatiferula olefinivorans]